MIKFVIPGRPPAKSNSYRIVRVGAFSRLASTPALNSYAKLVESISRKQTSYFNRDIIISSPTEVELMLIWHRADRRRKDLDNIAKSIMDGMTKGGIWSDDNQVTSLFLRSVVDAPSVEEEWVDVYVAEIPLVNCLVLKKKRATPKRSKLDILNVPDALSI